jgi:hypothetical protein
MGARGFGSFLVGFVRWFFLGRTEGGVTPEMSGYEAVVRARRAVSFHLLLRLLVVLVAIALVGWGIERPLLALAIFAASLLLGFSWFSARARARRLLIEAAVRPLTGTPALEKDAITAPRLLPGRAIQTLAVATDHARRGRVVEAAALTHGIDEPLLDDDELRLLAGVRAIIADRQRDRAAAARLAIAAFPVGAPDIDERLARIFAVASWHDATRLARAWEDWSSDGFVASTDEGVGRLLWLMEVKLGHRDAGDDPESADVMAEEARALGDRELADRIVSESRAGKASDYR